MRHSTVLNGIRNLPLPEDQEESYMRQQSNQPSKLLSLPLVVVARSAAEPSELS